MKRDVSMLLVRQHCRLTSTMLRYVIIDVLQLRPASRCGTETWPDLRLKSTPSRWDLVTFDLTWLDLTVACDLSRLQTTSQVLKLWWTCVNNAVTALSVLVLFVSHFKVLVLQLLKSVVVCFCAEAVRWNQRTSNFVYSKATIGCRYEGDCVKRRQKSWRYERVPVTNHHWYISSRLWDTISAGLEPWVLAVVCRL